MRYKLTVWIGAAVLAVVCAHVVQTIDRDIQLPGQETTASTSNDDNVNVQNIEKITSEDKEGDGEGTGNALNPKPEEGGQGSNDVGGNVTGDGDNETEKDSSEVLTPNSKEVPPNSDEQEGDDEGGEIGNIPKPDSSEVKPQSDELPMSRSEERVEPTTDIVQTDTGPVQGFYKNSDAKIRSYIDIPYGTFSGLFQAPVKSKSWITVHTVKEHEKRCPQIDEDDKFAGEIDCLTLSVFAPPDVENAPVLFHIYDGDFRTGSAYPSIYGPDYLVPKGIILVLPNYRVGPLGFLCMNNDVAPGNAALKDLTLALDWTKRNIERFGGNASRIVVSGYGKSGALAGYLAMSLKSRNYISGVITESGSVLAPWAIDRNPVDTVEKLTGVLEQNITAEIDLELLVTSAKNIDFMPCIENSTDGFMNETAWTILQDTNFGSLNIPFLIGSANHAGLHEATKHTTESLSQLNKNFSQFLPNDLKFKNEKDQSEAADKLKKLYFNDDDITTGNIHNISLCYTDAHYLGPVLRESRDLVQAGATVYLYEFSFVGGLNRESAALITTVQGAARGDIIGYTFVQDDDMPQEGTDEEKMVTLITDLWVSFIRKGEPSASGVTWNKLEKTEEENEQWLSMGAKVEAQKSLHVGRLGLWTQIYKDHYIERNLAPEIPSSLFVITTALWLSMTK